MAEVLDEGAAAGVDRRALIAGLYDAVIQNYLNRVKGSRSVGSVVFCQGMPFSSDALAAAVARQTGSEVVIPPSPGMMGALGIALLALKHSARGGAAPVELARFLEAKVAAKDVFVCAATRGCGGAGNKCRIDRLETVVAGDRKRFTWGGGCSLHDKGTRVRKLPDLAPDPFREREELVAGIAAQACQQSQGPRPRPRVALTDEFVLKSLFPFFATYLRELGCDVEVRTGADQRILKRGIEESNVPFCAPMQLYHGLARELAEGGPEFLFLPMLRSIPRVAGEKVATTCPIVQGSGDIVRWDLAKDWGPKIMSPIIDVGRAGLDSREFRNSCRRISEELGFGTVPSRRAWQVAREAQRAFDARCLEFGRRALNFCGQNGLVPVVVLGRAYTIHNRVLNSNVPAILREQGAMAIPVDCYPVSSEVPALRSIYWGYAQRNLRAAHQIRRTPGVYSVFCSNYSCGPDSFSLHFYSHVMEGKPYAVIETDGHSGDAGTKTRVEAFLHCVREDLGRREGATPAVSFHDLELRRRAERDIRRSGELVLIPRLGPSTEALAACLRGTGIDAEVLPEPEASTLRLGRRHTSGKECLPMCLTLGSLLERLERERQTHRKFAFLMPTSYGPCRFGVYNELHKIVLERLGWRDRVGIWSPNDADYFDEGGGTFQVVAFSGIAASDLLNQALHDARPAETRPGAAVEIWRRYRAELFERIEAASRRKMSLPAALLEVANGRLFGCAALLARAAGEFAAVKGSRDMPTVGVVGEIYARLNPCANDSLTDKLEARGIRTLVAPVGEWLAYAEYLARGHGGRAGIAARLSYRVLRRIQNRTRAVVARKLGWTAKPLAIEDMFAAAAPYLSPALEGEAVLTVGAAVAEWQQGHIDGVVSAGPLECMPNKVAQAQLFHAAGRERLPVLTLALNGEALDEEALENFVFEVSDRFRRRSEHGPASTRKENPARA
jgi:predicted nucleotide-binding protein (sugar kinase/HSP70/actin superfamily)